MTRTLATVTIIGVTTSALLWSTGASAQPGPSGGPRAQPVPTIPSDAQGSTLVEGKVVMVERDGKGGTILRLENGTLLVVNDAREPRAGDEIRAAYVETGGEKVVKFLRIISSPGL
jgi:hypothetical protein